MAITALHSAASGLRALSTRIDVVANNLANASTNSFKRDLATAQAHRAPNDFRVTLP